MKDGSVEKDLSKEMNSKLRLYSRDSFDRYGDDLCELLLWFLPLKEKLIFRCVSKQWMRCLFGRQTKIMIGFDSNETDEYNTIYELIDKENPEWVENKVRLSIVYNGIHKNGFESLLKNCLNIQVLSFDHCFIDEKIVELILEFCPHLSEIQFIDCFYKNVNSIIELGRVLGHSLRKVELSDSFKLLCIDFPQIDFNVFLSYCQNLRELKLLDPNCREKGFEAFFNSNSVHLPKLEKIALDLPSNEKLQKLKQFVDKYEHQLKGFEINFPFLKNKLSFETLAPIARCLHLESFGINDWNERYEVIPIVDLMLLMTIKCKELKHLSIDLSMNTSLINNLFVIIGVFHKLKSLKINSEVTDQEFNDHKWQTIECFKNCKQLIKIDLESNIISDSFLKDIDIHSPKLTFIRLGFGKKVTSDAMKSLAKLKNLKTLVLSSVIGCRYLEINFVTKDVILSLISNCTSLNRIAIKGKTFLNQFGFHLREYALKNPQRIQSFVFKKGNITEKLLRNGSFIREIVGDPDIFGHFELIMK